MEQIKRLVKKNGLRTQQSLSKMEGESANRQREDTHHGFDWNPSKALHAETRSRGSKESVKVYSKGLTRTSTINSSPRRN